MAQASNQERSKDPIIGSRSTIVGVSTKGDKRLQLYFSVEQAELLLTEAQSQLAASNGKGIKLDMFTRKKTATDTGREFDSTFMFVKAVQESSRGGGAGGAPATVARKFVPKKSVE